MVAPELLDVFSSVVSRESAHLRIITHPHFYNLSVIPCTCRALLHVSTHPLFLVHEFQAPMGAYSGYCGIGDIGILVQSCIQALGSQPLV